MNYAPPHYKTFSGDYRNSDIVRFSPSIAVALSSPHSVSQRELQWRHQGGLKKDSKRDSKEDSKGGSKEDSKVDPKGDSKGD